MLEKRLFKPELTTTFSTIVKEAVGFDLIFTTKDMTKGYNDILDKNLCFDLHKEGYSTGSLAIHFTSMHSNKFIYLDGTGYYYNGVYYERMDKKFTQLNNFVNENYHKHLVSYCFGELAKLNAKLSILDAKSDDETIKTSIKDINTEINNVNKFKSNINSEIRNYKMRCNLINDIINYISKNGNYFQFDKNPYLFAFTNKIYDL